MNPILTSLPRRQRGVALFVGLMLLLVLTLLGLSSSNVSIMQERMASNVAEYNLAFQRAEEALREAEQRVRSGSLSEANTWQGHNMQGLPNDCSLERRHGGNWASAEWIELDDERGILMVELNDYVNDDGLPTGSACRPATAGTRLDGSPIAGEYFVAVSRGEGPGDEARRAEVIVQSIFFWPQ